MLGVPPSGGMLLVPKVRLKAVLQNSRLQTSVRCFLQPSVIRISRRVSPSVVFRLKNFQR